MCQLIRGEGLPLDMTHAAGHRVVEGEPPIEKQLFAERDDGAVGWSGRQRRQPKRNSDFEHRLDGSQPQREVWDRDKNDRQPNRHIRRIN
jgi:hypothetical protein